MNELHNRIGLYNTARASTPQATSLGANAR